MYEHSGRKILDFSSQLMNANLGHGHPKVIEAIKKQAEELCFVTCSFATEIRGELGKKLAEEFGSYENWEADFKGVGTMRGIGWAILYQDNVSGRLINQWINEHDVGHPAGCTPLLILDVFEHAFMIDYGLKRADYITAFFKNIKWEAVESRMK